MKETSAVLEVEKKGRFFLRALKSALIALAISLIGVLIFAFLLRFMAIPDSVIKPVNQVIKVISLFVGCLIGLKKQKEMGLVCGLLTGLMYAIISFLVFSALDGNFEFSKTLINDILFGGVAGAICGIISVNFLRKRS